MLAPWCAGTAQQSGLPIVVGVGKRPSTSQRHGPTTRRRWARTRWRQRNGLEPWFFTVPSPRKGTVACFPFSSVNSSGAIHNRQDQLAFGSADRLAVQDPATAFRLGELPAHGPGLFSGQGHLVNFRTCQTVQPPAGETSCWATCRAATTAESIPPSSAGGSSLVRARVQLRFGQGGIVDFTGVGIAQDRQGPGNLVQQPSAFWDRQSGSGAPGWHNPGQLLRCGADFARRMRGQATDNA